MSAGAAWTSPIGIFAGLSGEWQIARRISNGARLDGHARFTPDGDGLDYREEGRLLLANGQSFQAERALRFELRPEGFDVFFAGRDTYLFHEIRLVQVGATWIGEGVHPCRDDLYRTRYVFGPDEGFAISHAVKGPRHDYTMTTGYRRPRRGP